MVQIIPAILPTTEKKLKEDLERVVSAESLKGGWVHFDFMDKKLVHNLSIEPEVLKGFEIPFKKEAHLMVVDPLNWLDKLIELEFDRIILHVEAEEVEGCIDYLKGKQIEVGVVLKIDTDLDRIEPFLEKVDVVLLMSIEAGFQGNIFKMEVLERIKELSRMKSEQKFLIGDDGGVQASNVRALVDAGCDNLIIGSHLIKGDIDENFKKLQEALQKS